MAGTKQSFFRAVVSASILWLYDVYRIKNGSPRVPGCETSFELSTIRWVQSIYWPFYDLPREEAHRSPEPNTRCREEKLIHNSKVCTNQKKELDLHDYKAEYEFYCDLQAQPETVPFLDEAQGFMMLPVRLYR